jgi:sugar phosphate isomerase/epimerase
MSFTRRSFLAMSAMLPFALRVEGASSSIPVGLELYSVRNALKQDGEATVRAVAGLGYQCVEFYAPYFEWTEAQTKQYRKLLDDLGIKCYSTHNDGSYLKPDKIQRALEMNSILGCRYVVVSHADPSPDGSWQPVADLLNSAAEKLEPAGLKAGYHNHQAEWPGAVGKRPMDFLAKNTKPTVMLQLDVGTCVEAGADPAAWIRANPGRIHSIHCKDWSHDPSKGYSVLFGEGDADWRGIFAAAESVGGVEYYLVEQEGSRFSEMETAQRCLQAFKAEHAA